MGEMKSKCDVVVVAFLLLMGYASANGKLTLGSRFTFQLVLTATISQAS